MSGELQKRFKNFDAPNCDEMLEGVSRAYKSFNDAIKEMRSEFPDEDKTVTIGDRDDWVVYARDIQQWFTNWLGEKEVKL